MNKYRLQNFLGEAVFLLGHIVRQRGKTVIEWLIYECRTRCTSHTKITVIQ